MQRFDRRLMSALVLAAGLPLVGACSSDSLSRINVVPKTSDVMRPDWLTYSGNKEEFTLRPAGPADLVGPDGQCAAAEPAVAAEPAGEGGVGGPLVVQGGIALQMT